MDTDRTESPSATAEPLVHADPESVHLALSVCTGCDNRYQMRRPWKAGAFVYASNSIIIARVPARLAPWVCDEPGRLVPCVTSLPWEPELYANSAVAWPRLKPAVLEPCEACQEDAGDDAEISVYWMSELDRAVPCPTCGMIAAQEDDAPVAIGGAVWRLRQMRKLRSIGAVLYPPLHPTKEGNRAGWRWEVPGLHMVGIVLPLKGEPS